MAGTGPLPGLADPPEAASDLVQSMLEARSGDPGIHVFVTHDSLVTATVARCLGVPLGPEEWPSYLEGAFFWRDLGWATHVTYKEYGAMSTSDGTTLSSPLVYLSDS